jgi:hypothetical protein
LLSRSMQGERRVSPSQYKLLLTAHVMVSVGWLGVVFAKLVLGLAAVTSSTPDAAAAVFLSTIALNVAFPPLAIATVVTGVLLSLSTKWGLLHYYWVATKLVLTVGVIATAVQIGGRLVQHSIGAAPVSLVDESTLLGIAWAPTLLIALSVVHLFMLGVATVLSVYKPWGMTRFGRRQVARREEALRAQPHARVKSTGVQGYAR